MHSQKAFTLIELLVVIAIIGVLSAIVLSSLSLSRHKADKAVFFSEFKSAATQAEVFYAANGNSYNTAAGTAADVCSPTASANGAPGIYSFGQDLQQRTVQGTLSANLGANSKWNRGSCHSAVDGASWAMDVPYFGSSAAVPVMFCIDSVNPNALGTSTGTLLAGATACP